MVNFTAIGDKSVWCDRHRLKKKRHTARLRGKKLHSLMACESCMAEVVINDLFKRYPRRIFDWGSSDPLVEVERS